MISGQQQSIYCCTDTKKYNYHSTITVAIATNAYTTANTETKAPGQYWNHSRTVYSVTYLILVVCCLRLQTSMLFLPLIYTHCTLMHALVRCCITYVIRWLTPLGTLIQHTLYLPTCNVKGVYSAVITIYSDSALRL